MSSRVKTLKHHQFKYEQHLNDICDITSDLILRGTSEFNSFHIDKYTIFTVILKVQSH